MNKKPRNVRGLWAMSGIAASTAIIALFVDAGCDPLDPLSLACSAAAAFSLVGALVQVGYARRDAGPGQTLDLGKYDFTSREKESVLELAAGYSVRKMAFRHDVADSTVRVVLCSIYKKLGVKDRAELLAFLARHEIKK